MTSVPLSHDGSILIDARGSDRVLKVSWHHEAGVVVLSLWRENLCAATFRLTAEDVPDLIDALRSGLDGAYDEVRASVAGVEAVG